MYCDDMLYICENGGNMVYGFNLEEIKYISGSDWIKDEINNCKNVKIIQERDYISYNMRKLTENKKYIIPYLAQI